MEQVIAQERSVPLQQNMVVIYRVEEAQKHSIGRVIHFDSENVSLEIFQCNAKQQWKSTSELANISRKFIVFGPIKLTKTGSMRKFLLKNHENWNF